MSIDQGLLETARRLQSVCAEMEIEPPVVHLASFQDGIRLRAFARMLPFDLISPQGFAPADPRDLYANWIEIEGVRFTWPERPVCVASVDERRRATDTQFR